MQRSFGAVVLLCAVACGTPTPSAESAGASAPVQAAQAAEPSPGRAEHAAADEPMESKPIKTEPARAPAEVPVQTFTWNANAIMDMPGHPDGRPLRADDVASVQASSTLQDKPAYAPQNLLDGDRATAWVEGSDGDGVGEWVEIRFAKPLQISGIRVWPGYLKSAKTLAENGRPASIRFTTDAGHQTVLTLDDVPADYPNHPRYQAAYAELGSEAPVSSLRMTVEAVHAGSAYKDLCLSGLSLEVVDP